MQSSKHINIVTPRCSNKQLTKTFDLPKIQKVKSFYILNNKFSLEIWEIYCLINLFMQNKVCLAFNYDVLSSFYWLLFYRCEC